MIQGPAGGKRLHYPSLYVAVISGLLGVGRPQSRPDRGFVSATHHRVMLLLRLGAGADPKVVQRMLRHASAR